ncbi:hypothetical protein AB0G71_03685 [Streptomyces sp. NPDC020403]
MPLRANLSPPPGHRGAGSPLDVITVEHAEAIAAGPSASAISQISEEA